ncbi:M23 family metallopeptidase [Paenibacillus sp. J2TS4]|uniref:M23 family metallopeptidase n=1 Tax=Paenibacillus sp. J2TS4 TaxID=2807194 RepID=UPI001B0D933F|nr:M23 family metallopeptidase [Paenibacillus sp. J2TS4]GIP31100.1 L-Ala--D-Glu endopeptidase [Paenibacillus sp. J2TS4]
MADLRHGLFRGLLVFTCAALLLGSPAYAAPVKSPSDARSLKEVFIERKNLLDQMSALTGIPWYYLAAVDQYERTMKLVRKIPLNQYGLIDIHYSDREWAGIMNPNPEDANPQSIVFFNGKGMDGDGDGLANRFNDVDVLYSMAQFLLKYGIGPEDFGIGLWEYYHNTRSVQRIKQFADIYAALDRLDLHQKAFPLPLTSTYSYRGTWGASRGWGGYRIHEGTDIFAGYGVPVRSTCYGVIEVKGWNRYGGWRMGIRDLNNVYHYYAHLSGFNKKWKEGDIIQPGEVIGWVGSSGYGRPGTSGKFPPHLHYGVYRDNGLTEWSFDPYPHLRKWEREERYRKKNPASS